MNRQPIRLDRRRFVGMGGAVAGWLLTNRTTWSGSLYGSPIAAVNQKDAPPQDAKQLIVHSAVPHNAEPALQHLVQSWITPLRHFYVRSHGPVPEIDRDQFRLSIEGLVDQPLQLSLAELRQLAKHSVTATLTCAGNRRSEHSLIKPVSGVQWQAGAIGNAVWGGVRLSDLLHKAKIQSGAKHVWFEGVDQIEQPNGKIPFGGSIPLDRALADSHDLPGALVAYEMNEQPLSPDHGFPMRTVVPGVIGARSVKWLGKITVSDRPSPNHFVADTYKLVTHGTPEELAATPPLYDFAMNSVTCLPERGARVRPGNLTVTGYALATGAVGRTIAAVEVSTDGGQVWRRARFTSAVRPYCWCLWSAEVTVSPTTRELLVRATDSTGKMQPEQAQWNQKGYQFDGWHHSPIQVDA